MRIPVIVHHGPREQQLAAGELPCATCQMPTPHRAVRTYNLLRLYYLPMFSTGTTVQRFCSRCGSATMGAAPPGAASKPFLHRMGCLIWLGLPALGLAGYFAYSNYEDGQRRAAYEAEQKANAASAKLAKKAKTKAEAATKACFAALNDAIPDKKIIDHKPLAPKDKAAVKGAVYVNVKRSTGAGVPRPGGSDYIGPHACKLTISATIKDAALELTGADGYDAADVTAKSEELLAEAEALGTPKAMVVTDFRCTKPTCRVVGVWVDVASKEVLAVAEAKVPMENLGYDEDTNALALKLRDVVNAW